MPGQVLIVEDEARLGRNMRIFLERQGYRAEHVESTEDGFRRYLEIRPDIVLVDHNLPDGTGLDLITRIRDSDRWTKLVMVTAHGGVELAVAAMKAGADDYLTKPVSLDEMAILIGKLVRQADMEGSLAYFRSREEAASGLDRIVGTSRAILELKRKIGALTAAENAAGTNRVAGPPVLILGESGTGKELVARAIHYHGPRRDASFIGMNCAALPEQLAETELFGHERGAFTGAGERRIGLIQAADGGTLFLDELAELPLSQQSKLLRVIEERVVRPVGGVRDRDVDVRFVAATNAAIEERTRQAEFRSDLLYRLNTITIEVPPLRNRDNDVILIAESFIAAFERRYGRAGLSLTEAARDALLGHSWPGNIRELRNVIEQATLMSARNRIDADDLALRSLPSVVAAPSGILDGKAFDDAEKRAIIDALRTHGGNVTMAARTLGVSRDTLRYRMEKHALRRDYYVAP
jgi:two-component system response regulator AtoC